MKWSCLRNRFTPGGLRVPVNATLTPRTRLRLARLIVEQGWSCATATKMFMVAPRTAANGPSSAGRRPGRDGRSQLEAAPQPEHDTTAWGTPDRAAEVVTAARPGTDRRSPRRTGLDRARRTGPLPHQPIDGFTAEPPRRYEHDHPGSLIHVDVTKFGNIHDSGGWRYLGQHQGKRNAQATARSRTGYTDKYHPNNGTRLPSTAPWQTAGPPTHQLTNQRPWTSQLVPDAAVAPLAGRS